MLSSILKRRRPRALLIDPKFQLNVITYAIVLGVVNFVILYAAFRYGFKMFFNAGVDMKLSPQNAYFQLLRDQVDSFTLIFGMVGFANACIVIVGGLILSHRVAGPLYRLKTHISQINAGITTGDVKFRKKDYFQDLAEVYNEQLHKGRKEKTKRVA